MVNEAVEAIAKIGRGQYRSFANAVLRRFLRERDRLAASCKKDDTAKYNLPRWWLDYLRNHYPKHWNNIVTAFQLHPPMTLRVNRRHGNAENYLAELAAAGIAAKALDDCAVTLEAAVPVHSLPGFQTALCRCRISAHSRRRTFCNRETASAFSTPAPRRAEKRGIFWKPPTATSPRWTSTEAV